MEPEQPLDYLNDRNVEKHGDNVARYLDLAQSPVLHGVRIKLLSKSARIPVQGSPDAAGYDLFASGAVNIPPHRTELVPLGFATEMAPSIHARIESRSGLAANHGLVVLTGVIDSDYRGEWMVILHNLQSIPHTIAPGTKIAQAVFRPTLRIAFKSVSDLPPSTRGAGGFGSTGR